jgi:hypothetical protein
MVVTQEIYKSFHNLPIRVDDTLIRHTSSPEEVGFPEQAE